MFDVGPLPDPDAGKSFGNPGLSLGAGFDLRLSPENSLCLGAALHFTKISGGGDGSKRHYVAGIGFAFHPPAR